MPRCDRAGHWGPQALPSHAETMGLSLALESQHCTLIPREPVAKAQAAWVPSKASRSRDAPCLGRVLRFSWARLIMGTEGCSTDQSSLPGILSPCFYPTLPPLTNPTPTLLGGSSRKGGVGRGAQQPRGKVGPGSPRQTWSTWKHQPQSEASQRRAWLGSLFHPHPLALVVARVSAPAGAPWPPQPARCSCSGLQVQLCTAMPNLGGRPSPHHSVHSLPSAWTASGSLELTKSRPPNSPK